ncbi:MAG: hypothetical protein M3Z05_18790 [Gemmatimonadota bacterium]|nr:hypothetical protein [Gemmatimonadota bacterium]
MNSKPPKFNPLGLGYIQDKPDDRDLLSHDAKSRSGLFGATPTVVVPASMMQFRKGALYQGQAGSCVAHALARAVDMCARAELAVKNSKQEPPKMSRRYAYFNARQQENVDAIQSGQPMPKMTDAGCMPRLAMRAIQKLGFCDEVVFPYTDDPRAINEVPPPLAFKEAYDQIGFRYSRPLLHPVAECARALAMQKPFIFGMFVDTPFMNNGGDIIRSVNTRDPDGGGHMLCGLEITANEVIFDNWWCPPGSPSAWGSLGIGRMTHELFSSAIVTDRYIIEAAPLFPEVP